MKCELSPNDFMILNSLDAVASKNPSIHIADYIAISLILGRTTCKCPRCVELEGKYYQEKVNIDVIENVIGKNKYYGERRAYNKFYNKAKKN